MDIKNLGGANGKSITAASVVPQDRADTGLVAGMHLLLELTQIL